MSTAGLRLPSRRMDITGQRFGRLVAIRYLYIKNSDAFWECRCDCGELVAIRGSQARSGKTLSCGCLRRELSSARASGQIIHGGARRGDEAPEYMCWRGMIERCHNPKNTNYIHYGGRGIHVCNEWRRDFAAFVAHGPRVSMAHSVDRIDNDRGYEPGNVRWATQSQQLLNKRCAARVAADKAHFLAEKLGLLKPEAKGTP